jgi:hypothetical protein
MFNELDRKLKSHGTVAGYFNVWEENKIFQHYLCSYTISCGETTLRE